MRVRGSSWCPDYLDTMTGEHHLAVYDPSESDQIGGLIMAEPTTMIITHKSGMEATIIASAFPVWKKRGWSKKASPKQAARAKAKE